MYHSADHAAICVGFWLPVDYNANSEPNGVRSLGVFKGIIGRLSGRIILADSVLPHAQPRRGTWHQSGAFVESSAGTSECCR